MTPSNDSPRDNAASQDAKRGVALQGAAATAVANKLAANEQVTWQDAAALLKEHHDVLDALNAIVERSWMVTCDWGPYEEWERVIDAGRRLVRANTHSPTTGN